MLAARAIDERSRLFVWVKIVAVTLLAAVVSRLVYAPAPSLALIPAWIRIAAVAIGVACFFVARRRLALGILAGEAAFVAMAYLAA